MNKRLILNADDFGLTAGINYGILDAYLQHSISSISLIVNAPHSQEAMELMKHYQIHCVGIHVNITLGYPISKIQDIPSLVDESGCFHKSDWWETHQANVDELILEFDSQIALFEKLTGQKPGHINYHHRYDFYKHYPALAKHLFTTYQLPMRLEREEEGYSYEYALNQAYFMQPELSKFKSYLTTDLIEMPCHVGFVDQEIMKISQLNMERMRDYALVTSKEFQKVYQDLGYQLVGWDTVMKK